MAYRIIIEIEDAFSIHHSLAREKAQRIAAAIESLTQDDDPDVQLVGIVEMKVEKIDP